jgi:hypothetical protein
MHQQLNKVHISAFAPEALDSFDETFDGNKDDNCLVPVSSSSSETHAEEKSIDATLEKIQKVCNDDAGVAPRYWRVRTQMAL